jgi:hypothetical protein
MNLNGYNVIARKTDKAEQFYDVVIEGKVVGYVWKNDPQEDWSKVSDLPGPTGWGARYDDRSHDPRDGFKTRRDALLDVLSSWRFYRDEVEREAFERYLDEIRLDTKTDEVLAAERELYVAQHEAMCSVLERTEAREGFSSKAGHDLALEGDKIVARVARIDAEMKRRAASDLVLSALTCPGSPYCDCGADSSADERMRLDFENVASSRIVETTDREGEPIELDLGLLDSFGERSVYLGSKRLGFVKGWAPLVP